MKDTSGNQIGTTMKYLPFRENYSNAIPTDKLFTGQRLDGTGIHYYRVRYYNLDIKSRCRNTPQQRLHLLLFIDSIRN
jgi:hypothetical protein